MNDIHIIDIDNNAYIDMAQASSYDSELYAYKVNCKLLYKIIISFSNLTHTLYLRTIYTTFTINAEHLALPQILGGATILWTKLILELLHNQSFTFFYLYIESICDPFWISYTSSVILEMSYLGANIGASNFF